MNDSIHNIHNVYSRPPVRSEIWDISHCQQREISPIRTATNVSLSSFLCLPSSHPPSLPLALLLPLSLFLIPFLLCSHTEARRLERLWVYVQSGRGSTQRINALLENPQEIQASPCPRSFSFCPDSSHPPASILMCPFHSHFLSLSPFCLSLSLHLSLVQANVCVRFGPISVNVMQGASQSTQ